MLNGTCSIRWTLLVMVVLGIMFHVGDSFLVQVPTARINHYHGHGHDHCRVSTQLFVTVGFVGCGTIACAIATGLATQHDVVVNHIAVSQRSQSKSQALWQQFPDLITIHTNNQDVVDQADIVFLCVLPQQTTQVLQELKLDSSRHVLVSLVVRTVSFYCLAC